MRITTSITVRATAARVFEAVDKDEEVKQWSKYFIENQYEYEDDRYRYFIGMKYKTIQKVLGKVYEVQAQLVEYNPPTRVVARGTIEGYRVLITYELEQQNDVVVVTQLQEYEASTWGDKLSFYLTSWLSKIVQKQEMERMKKYVEANPN